MPHLERWVEDPLTRVRNFQDPYQSFVEILNLLRDERASGDVARLHAFFKKRVAEHSSERRAFDTLPDMSK